VATFGLLRGENSGWKRQEDPGTRLVAVVIILVERASKRSLLSAYRGNAKYCSFHSLIFPENCIIISERMSLPIRERISFISDAQTCLMNYVTDNGIAKSRFLSQNIDISD
jgi:hypothetical protein